MSRLVKIVDNKYVQIEEYRNPNICFNTSEYDDFEDYCTLRETFDPFEMFYENQELKKQLHEASLNIQEMTERDIYCPSSCDKLEELLKENQKLKKQLKPNYYVSGLEGTLKEYQQEMNNIANENSKLKKQIEEYQKELEKADSITQSCIFDGKEESKILYRKCLNVLDKMNKQQKEFVKYLESMLDDENDIFSVVRVKDVLQKYKEMLGDDK